MSEHSNIRRANSRSNGAKPNYPLWVSESKKKANNYELAKDFIDYFDFANPVDSNRVKKIQENFELHSGRWPNIKNIRDSFSISLGNESITLGSGELNHYPIIDRVSKSVVSDLILRPLIPVIKDYSSKARNYRERIRLERVLGYFQNTIVKPMMQEITMQYDMRNGVTDFTKLPIEDQQQRQFDIEQQFKNQAPEELIEALEQSNTPDELVADALLREGLRYTNAKSKFDIGSENAVVTAEEYYRLSILNGMPNIEVLNPKWVTWGGSENTLYAEDGQFARYEQYLTPEDVITKYAHFLVKKDIQDLSNLYSQIPGYEYSRKNQQSERGIERKLVDLFAANPELEQSIDVRTREGQERYRQLYASLTHNVRDGWGVREAYITFRWLRRVKFVDRVVNGEIKTFIRDEHYQKDALAGDVKVTERAIPQAWHGVKLGEEFYINVEPIPNQYKNINDPFDVKLGIYGGKYNTFQNNVRNASLIDLGKPWQYKYNSLVKKMEEHQATDIGKVFLGTANMRPKGWSWAQWFKSMFLGRAAIVANHTEGINSLDTSVFRSIDLSRTIDIENDIRQLEYFENKIITSMYYSPQKIGDISQYSTNRNTQMAIQGVDRQMYRFHNKNREIKERVLDGFLHLCLFAYKDNDDVKNTVLSDFLKAHYELNFNTTDFPNFTLKVVDDFRESEKLSELKNLALTFLQNGMTGKELIAIMDGDSMSEIKKVITDIERRREKMTQEQYEREKALIDEQRKSAEAQMKMKQEYDAMVNERNNEVKIKLAEINSRLMENANDVDRNNMNDSLQRVAMELEAKMKMEENRHKNEQRIVDKKLEVEREKIKSKK